MHYYSMDINDLSGIGEQVVNIKSDGNLGSGLINDAVRRCHHPFLVD